MNDHVGSSKSFCISTAPDVIPFDMQLPVMYIVSLMMNHKLYLVLNQFVLYIIYVKYM